MKSVKTSVQVRLLAPIVAALSGLPTAATTATATITTATLATALTTPAHAADELKKLSNGEHSIKSLGPDFGVEVPVRRIADENIQLVFVNYDLAKELGIELPKDPVELEKMAKEAFGWEVDPTNTSQKKWYATNYLDSEKKGPGQAMGDGRALFTGELQLTRTDGRILYIDAVQKGVGVTPFAWLKNKSHSDGLQTVNELVDSAYLSRANTKNQLDSTADLFGFRVMKDGQVKSMTLRLGNQTRVAHPRFHSDTVVNFRKIMDYVIVRDLGLPLNTEVTRPLIMEWMQMFTENLAVEAARFFDLDAIQESPTAGNKTSRGGTIDLAGVRYFDAYHGAYTHLFGRIMVDQQNTYMKGYITMIQRYMSDAHYLRPKDSIELRDEMREYFDRRYTEELSLLTLMRLGLTQAEAKLVPQKQAFQLALAVNALKRAKGTKHVKMHNGNENVRPTAFDTRKILAGTMRAYASFRREDAVKEIFRVDRSWQTEHNEAHQKHMTNYIAAVEGVLNSIGHHKFATWATNAEKMNHRRLEMSSNYDFWNKYLGPAIEAINKGDVSHVEITKLIDRAGDALVDPGLPERPITMLKTKKAPVYTHPLFKMYESSQSAQATCRAAF